MDLGELEQNVLGLSVWKQWNKTCWVCQCGNNGTKRAGSVSVETMEQNVLGLSVWKQWNKTCWVCQCGNNGQFVVIELSIIFTMTAKQSFIFSPQMSLLVTFSPY
ncbi:hypothetical protein OTU49_007811 [Cherax quadricarinatus]|uniref:Uncharacterized protein n=1 Tax=Cherax quadricarinatus TaxID=27406 RepID=A0AAW0WV65_CHEQU